MRLLSRIISLHIMTVLFKLNLLLSLKRGTFLLHWLTFIAHFALLKRMDVMKNLLTICYCEKLRSKTPLVQRKNSPLFVLTRQTRRFVSNFVDIICSRPNIYYSNFQKWLCKHRLIVLRTHSMVNFKVSAHWPTLWIGPSLGGCLKSLMKFK